MKLADLTIKIFADGADFDGIVSLAKNPLVEGFTTNPTLMRKAGVTDYELFSRMVIEAVAPRPVSLEVFADDLPEMARHARIITTWGRNVYVKIPVMNSRGESTVPVIADLSSDGIPLNVTAVFSHLQAGEVVKALNPDVRAIISMFAGRMADCGVDPKPHLMITKGKLRDHPRTELLWASPRQAYDAIVAQWAGCDIITMTPDLIAKLALFGKDLLDFSRETVEMFYRDALAAGYSIEEREPACCEVTDPRGEAGEITACPECGAGTGGMRKEYSSTGFVTGLIRVTCLACGWQNRAP